MSEQLKECLIVRAVSIFTKRRKVNGFGSGSSPWIGKPADWISCKEGIAFWIKNAPLWSVQNSPDFIYFIRLDMANPTKRVTGKFGWILRNKIDQEE